MSEQPWSMNNLLSMQSLKWVERRGVNQSQVTQKFFILSIWRRKKQFIVQFKPPKTGPLDYRMQAQRAQVKI